MAHRDTKIDNFLSDSNNDLKLIDYGPLTKYKDDEFLNHLVELWYKQHLKF